MTNIYNNPVPYTISKTEFKSSEKSNIENEIKKAKEGGITAEEVDSLLESASKSDDGLKKGEVDAIRTALREEGKDLYVGDFQNIGKNLFI